MTKTTGMKPTYSLTLQPDKAMDLTEDIEPEEFLQRVRQTLADQKLHFDQFLHAEEALAEACRVGIFRVGDTGALMMRSHEIENTGWEVIGFGLPLDPETSPEAAVLAVWQEEAEEPL